MRVRALPGILVLLLAGAFPAFAAAALEPEATELALAFRAEVNRRLEVPERDLPRYALLLDQAASAAGITTLGPQLFVLVDRNPQVQAAMVLWKSADGSLQLIGASPASTGRPGRYEYFETPLGLFRHHPGNMDFRAEGTRNDNGILGYGPGGTRVYDFGWQVAPRGWGSGGASLMRLQMHATDPEILEPRLGTAQSKGCIRIPLSLNRYLDRRGILDADYEDAAASGMKMWIWRADRSPTATPGRYLAVVDSGRTERPDWSPMPSPTPAAPEHE